MQTTPATDATRYAQLLERHGFSATHKQIIGWVPRGSRVLELGCASGYVGQALIEQKGCSVVGVEIDPAAAADARKRGLHVLEGSLSDAAFRASLRDRYDVVMAADVLEHLADPAPVLEDIKRWIAPDGYAIVAVPNVATWSIREQLFFRGDFEYREDGILDRTHLRFFTWHTFHALLAEQRWEILDRMIDAIDFPLSGSVPWHWPDPLLRLARPLVSAKLSVVRYLGSAAVTALDELVAARESVLRAMLGKWPNLCATHIAVLLRPPR